MIRTRDFLIYVSVLVFLVSAIGYTVAGDLAAEQPRTVTLALDSLSSPATAFGAVASNVSDSREAYRDAMREKLARGEGTIENAPVVLTSVKEPEPPAVSMPTVTERAELRCDTQTSAPSSWNPSAISMQVIEGVRLVLENAVDASTAPTLRIQLPVRTARDANDACIPNDVVGIAMDGQLIKNNDAGQYTGFGPTAQIGYALDGLPIFGTQSEEGLDACGGTHTATGYQYHLRADEPFVLGCFAAHPAAFLQ